MINTEAQGPPQTGGAANVKFSCCQILVSGLLSANSPKHCTGLSSVYENILSSTTSDLSILQYALAKGMDNHGTVQRFIRDTSQNICEAETLIFST